METKEQLVHLIKEWIQSAEEIKELSSLLRKKKENKKSLSDQLVDVMKTNEIDCFDINNGKLVYSKNKVKQSISKKYLLSKLSNYLNNQEEGLKLTEYLLNNREEKIRENIKRKVDK